jgi:hypothetical protein
MPEFTDPFDKGVPAGALGSLVHTERAPQLLQQPTS